MRIKPKSEELLKRELIQARQENDKVIYALPIKEKPEDFDPKNYVTQAHVLVKKHIGKLVNGEKWDFDMELEKLFNQVHNESYSRGLRDNEQIHQRINKIE